MVRRLLLTILGLLLTPALCWPAPSGPGKLGDVLPLLDAGSPDALAGVLRGVLLKAMPDPLYEASPGWGDTTQVHTVKWKGQGFRTHPNMVKVAKNDGKWRKIRLTAVNPQDTLVLDVRDVQQPEPLHLTFTVFMSFDARVEFEQQNWESGIRLYSGSLRARLRPKLLLDCEAHARLEFPADSFLPDAVFSLRVMRADLKYDNLQVDHVAGVGGTAAHLLGDAFHSTLRQWRPSVERNLLARANEAIVKAGSTREVRVSLSHMLSKALEQQKAKVIGERKEQKSDR